MFNENSKDNSIESDFDLFGNSRQHVVNNWFNDTKRGEVVGIDNDSSGNSRHWIGVNGVDKTCKNSIGSEGTETDRNPSGKSRPAIVTDMSKSWKIY